jgi:hypothetical protein
MLAVNASFTTIIGKEYVDGGVHYIVDWTLTLVRASVLGELQAAPLISGLEARCQAQRGDQSCLVISQLDDSEASSGTAEKAMQGRGGKPGLASAFAGDIKKKQRGRPRKLACQRKLNK